ncbi:hypothetical protein Cgig2_001443 [Carnegiea gigantea]|uniref:ABC transporter domain-containing protein n=1 Tax=Carnegiea gigantea TaxID=171969 RepID=A0A9Q1QPI4_9CARY|nr:hypothetical protein Cgig2_001443 [Carnegiea gigantea]
MIGWDTKNRYTLWIYCMVLPNKLPEVRCCFCAGEMIVGPKKTLFMDEISTGNFVHQIEGTVLMALLQPAPETFEVFDDLMLLSEWHMIYHGPRAEVLEFFESLGFKLPPRKGAADFLQEVTSRKDQEQYWADPSQPYRFIPAEEIAKAFRASPFGMSVTYTLSVPYDKSKSHPLELFKEKYAVPKWELFKACLSREVLLIRRNKLANYDAVSCHCCKNVSLTDSCKARVAFVGFVTGTTFFRTGLHPTNVTYGNLYLSCLFYGFVYIMFNGMSELSLRIFQLPVFYKQRDNCFYPAWAWSLSGWILRVPYSVIEAVAMKERGVLEKRLQLLSDVSGVFSPGVLTALVGPNGAGKTTLVDVLAGQKTGGYIEGDIRISGYPKEQHTFARISGYVEDIDIHSPQVTVEESLWFSASLHLANDISQETKKVTVNSQKLIIDMPISYFVDEVMMLVELDSLEHALVGMPGSIGLSTEQRKRLTIGVELSSSCMDEPTSGLDARVAAIVMRVVRNTVDTGRTVVCTVHQPINPSQARWTSNLWRKARSSVWDYERLFLGDSDSNPNSFAFGLFFYVTGIGGIPPIPDGYNPTTRMLEVTTPVVEQSIGQDLADIYLSSNQLRFLTSYIIKAYLSIFSHSFTFTRLSLI